MKLIIKLYLFISIFQLYSINVLALNLEQIQKKYKSIKSFNSKIRQEKYAKYLFKPLKSYGTFSFNNKEMHWEINKPVKSSIRIDNNSNIRIDNKSYAEIPKQFKMKIVILIKLIKQFFKGHFNEIKINFNISITNNTLIAKLKNKSALNFINSFTIEFNSDFYPKKIIILTKNEKTIIYFLNLKIK